MLSRVRLIHEAVESEELSDWQCEHAFTCQLTSILPSTNPWRLPSKVALRWPTPFLKKKKIPTKMHKQVEVQWSILRIFFRNQYTVL